MQQQKKTKRIYIYFLFFAQIYVGFMLNVFFFAHEALFFCLILCFVLEKIGSDIFIFLAQQVCSSEVLKISH